MLSRTIADFMELNALIHLLAKAFACCAVRRVESSVVAICTSSSADLSITIRARKARIKDYLLEPLAVLSLEISHKGIVSLPVRESVIFVTHS